MQQGDSIEEQFTDRMSYVELLRSCRSQIESLQNLSYLTSLDAEHPTQVRLNIRMMEWHLHNLSEALLV
jgi:PHP family Zn ribbon phosphoesterase